MPQVLVTAATTWLNLWCLSRARVRVPCCPVSVEGNCDLGRQAEELLFLRSTSCDAPIKVCLVHSFSGASGWREFDFEFRRPDPNKERTPSGPQGAGGTETKKDDCFIISIYGQVGTAPSLKSWSRSCRRNLDSKENLSVGTDDTKGLDASLSLRGRDRDSEGCPITPSRGRDDKKSTPGTEREFSCERDERTPPFRSLLQFSGKNVQMGPLRVARRPQGARGLLPAWAAFYHFAQMTLWFASQDA